MNLPTPSSELSNKTNINPSIDRFVEATAEDFTELVDLYLAIKNWLEGKIYIEDPLFLGVFNSVSFLETSHPSPNTNSIAFIKENSTSPLVVGKFFNNEWVYNNSDAELFVDIPFLNDLPVTGTSGKFYRVLSDRSIWTFISGVPVNLSSSGNVKSVNGNFPNSSGNVLVNMANILREDLDSDSTELGLSLKGAKSLKGLIDEILSLLNSDDVNLDELQEVVDYIKANREDLQNLSIENIAGLVNALGLKANDADLHVVAKSGSFNDLENRPDPIDISGKTDKGGYNGTSRDLFDRINLIKNYNKFLSLQQGDVFSTGRLKHDYETPGNFDPSLFTDYDIIYGFNGGVDGYLHIRQDFFSEDSQPLFYQSYGSVYRLVFFESSESNFGDIRFRVVDVYGGKSEVNNEFYSFSLKRVYNPDGVFTPSTPGQTFDFYTHFSESFLSSPNNSFNISGKILLQNPHKAYINFKENYWFNTDFDMELKNSFFLPKGKKITSIEFVINNYNKVDTKLLLQYFRRRDDGSKSVSGLGSIDLNAENNYRNTYRTSISHLINNQVDQNIFFYFATFQMEQDFQEITVESYRITTS